MKVQLGIPKGTHTAQGPYMPNSGPSTDRGDQIVAIQSELNSVNPEQRQEAKTTNSNNLNLFILVSGMSLVMVK